MTPPFARIEELKTHAGQLVTVRGWVTHLRSSGKVAFLVIRDGSGVVQCVVVKSQVPPEVWSRFAELTQETTVAVTGEPRIDARAPGGVELGVSNLVILGTSPNDYPIQPKEHGIDFLLDNRHSGFAAHDSGRSFACGTRSSRRSTISSMNAASCASTPQF